MTRENIALTNQFEWPGEFAWLATDMERRYLGAIGRVLIKNVCWVFKSCNDID